MTIRILTGDCRDVLATLPAESVHCIVTSPPYFGLRDYGVAGQIGLEETPAAYVKELVGVFRECRRVLRNDGTLWLNLGDSYASQPAGNKTPCGLSQTGAKREGKLSEYNTQKKNWGDAKPKDLIGIPWMVAFALRDDGWYLRSDIIWAKPNPMPESVTDRPTKAHEYLFLLSKNARYYFDAEAVRQDAAGGRVAFYGHGQKGADVSRQDGGRRDATVVAERNIRSVWTVATQPFSEAHFATFPPGLIEPCIKAGCPTNGTCLDPFGGAGTTGLVADRLRRNAILIELNPAYAEMATRRVNNDAGMFAEVEAA